MTSNTSNESISKEDMDLWSRIMTKRKKEWSALPPATVMNIVRDSLNNKDKESCPPEDEAYKRLEWLFDEHFHCSIDSKNPPQIRRKALKALSTLLERVDEEYKKSSWNMQTMTQQSCSNREKENEVTRKSMASINSGAGNKNNAVVDPDQVPDQPRRTIPEPGPVTVAQKPSESKKPEAAASPKSSARPQHHPASPPDLARTAQAGSTPPRLSAAASSADPSIPAVADPTSSAHPGMGVSLSKPAKVASMPAESSMTAKAESTINATRLTKTEPFLLPKQSAAPTSIQPIPQDQIFATDKVLPAVSAIWFAKDPTGALSGALMPRSTVKVTYQQWPVTPQFMRHVVDRFSLWDPYWRVERTVAVAVTQKTSRLEKLAKGDPEPHQATSCEVRLKPAEAKTMHTWGTARSDSHFSQGERRFMLRMLPLNSGRKKKRADTHLWPEGTFVQVGGCPVSIVQRRQQSHDPSEWKYMCKPLDLTEHIKRPSGNNRVEMCFYDNQQYVMCLAICSYQTPNALYDRVLNEWADKLSEKDATAYALQMANQQTVVLEDADPGSDELNSFIFKLTCPLSMQLIKTPVRGKQCTHWQCFDLRNFLEANQSISGIRWQCPVCGNLVSCRDLQVCGLTQKVLAEFEGQARPHQDRVQFFANATWKLLDETKKRYNRKRKNDDDGDGSDAKRSRQNGTPVEHEVIDLL